VKITLGILKQAKDLSIRSYWLQPGAEDAEVVEYIKENLADRAIYGGPCILVQGDGVMAQIVEGVKLSPKM
jgi:predicted CoA-binding protein